MKAVICQTDIIWENKSANHAKVRSMLENSAETCRGALIVLPEMFATGFSLDVPKVVEEPGGESETFLVEIAKRHQACVVGGLVNPCAKSTGKSGLNQSLVVSPTGEILARYSKMQPFTLGGESANIAPGQSVTQFEFAGFKIAPFVCYDLRFPEIFRQATVRGAQLITVIANWPLPRDGHWIALLKARAIENQAYVIGVNRVGRDPRFTYPGRSLIIDPRGETLADAGNGESITSAKLDLQPLLDYRRDFPALADIRPEFRAVYNHQT